jgi:NAD(P)-dependent dehydrogenase (short-subunit alcohol dehydrogenase family)
MKNLIIIGTGNFSKIVYECALRCREYGKEWKTKGFIYSDNDIPPKNLELYPLKRHGKPEDIAFGVIYLLSDASSWVTGEDLIIDGGVALRK